MTRRVTASWSAQSLTMLGDAFAHHVPAASLSVGRGGWADQHTTLSWTDGDGAWALSLHSTDARALAADAPPGVRDRLLAVHTATRRTHTARRAVWGAILGVVLVGAAVLFLLRDRLVDAAVHRIPPSAESHVADWTEKHLLASGTVVNEGAAADAVRLVGHRLLENAPPSSYTFRFFVVRDTTINAYATPGGVIVVHTGLLRRASGPEELAGVIAHEIAHVLHRDALHRMVVQSGSVALIQLLVGDPGSTAGSLAHGAAQLGALRYGRSQEERADLTGIELLRAARLPADGLVRFFGTLSSTGGEPPAFLSSHPPSERRARTVQRSIAQRPAWPVEPITLDWTGVQHNVAR